MTKTKRPPKAKTISEYVRRVLDENELSQHDVERRSQGRITNSYLSKLLSGSATNLTVEKLKALADGLGVSHAQIAEVAFELKGSLTQDREEEEFKALFERFRHLSAEQKSELRVLIEMVDHEIDRRQNGG